MKPYGIKYFKHKSVIRSNTKTSRLICKNADRSFKKSVRNKIKQTLKNNLMRAVDFDEIEVGNKILMDIPGNGRMTFEVSEIDEEDRSVLCKDNCLNFYPNEDDQYIVVD